MQNTFYHGDCLFVLNHDVPSQSIDLIYLDPPFFTGKVQKGKWHPGDMEVSFEDSKKFWQEKGLFTFAPEWLKHIAIKRPAFASYLYYMMERLQSCHKVLKPTGSIYLHCDYRASHYLKMVMDEIFEDWNFRNEIIWHYGGRGAKAISSQFPRNSDTILFYTKSKNATFNKLYKLKKIPVINANKYGIKRDEQRRWFKTSPRGDYTDESVKRLEAKGRVYKTKSGNIRIKYFLDEEGDFIRENELISNVWGDIPDMMHAPKEYLGYPTQKPEALLERIIEASSNEGDLVLDPFCGCGTTIIVASKLGRRFIGVDKNSTAFTVIKNRSHELFCQSQYISRDLDEVLGLAPHPFQDWVNQFFGAIKPTPDRGIDGITSEGMPIQSKTHMVGYDKVSQFLTDAKYHPKVPQPIKRIILVSQKGFDDSTRQRQYEIESGENIKVELLIPEKMLR